MVSLIDVAIVVLALTSLAIIARNILSSSEIRYPMVSRRGSLRIEVDGRKLRGVALVAEKVPEGDSLLAEKIAEIARSMGVSLTIASSVLVSGKGRLLGYIEEEIKKSELAYESTKHVRYLERLKALKELYKRVSVDHKPLLGSLSVILWVPEDEKSGETVSAFKALLEAETGVVFREARAESIADLVKPPQLEDSMRLKPAIITSSIVSEKQGVVVGRKAGEHEVVVLAWPQDFDAHMGVFGATGRGKTVLLAGVAAQLGARSESRLDPYMVAVLDPKGDLARLLSRVATAVRRAGRDYCIPIPTLEGLAVKLLESSRETSWSGDAKTRVCSGSMLERGLVVYDFSDLESSERNVAVSLALASLLLEAEERGLPGRVVVVVDEAWRISSNLALHLTLAAREGRSKHLHLVYATQSPSDIPQIVLDNTKTIAVFGGFTRNYTELAHKLGLSSPEALLKLPVGHAVIKVGDRPPVSVLVYNFEEHLKTGALRLPELSADSPALGAGSGKS